MSNYSTLKAAISAVIKENNNHEITGQVLQTTLLAMVDSLAGGYLFKGIATPATVVGTPDENVFYIGGAGTYSNFGATPVNVPDCCIGIFTYNGSFENHIIPTGGVFDISAYNAVGGTPATYADLTAALGTNGANIPDYLRKGGMSVKFIQGSAQSSDNNYTQYRCKSKDFSINVTDWVCEDDIAVKGENNKTELSITDVNYYAILRLLSYLFVDADGNVRTKNFNSAEQAIIKSGLTVLANKFANTFPESTPNTFSVEDENYNAILYLLNYLKVDADGNILTKAFDSSLLKVIADEDDTFRLEDTEKNAILLLQNYLKVDKDGNISTKAFSSAKRKETLIIVDANGNGDYTTIEDALNNANDSATHHVNILIKEGVYYPAPKVSNVKPYQENNRNISLIGEDRNKCIIRNDIGFYDYTIGTDCTPLRLNGNVVIKNLTILSYSTLYRQYYGTPGFVTERADRNSSYCIHRDGNSNEGDEFVIKDCILINDHFTCVGFGLQNNVTLRIEDCYCQSEENEDDSAESQYGVLYGHFGSGKKGLNQNLEVIRCQLVNKSSYQAISLMDAKASDATPQDTFANLKFIGNIVDTTNNTNAFVTQNTIEGFYAISKLSFGNKCEAMNYNV